MVLQYFRGNNFGDELNPLIFHKLLPDFFDEEAEGEFLGIGSILGLLTKTKAKRKIIFSSGYGQYGKVPALDDSFDIICVRGPLTAKALKLDPKLAVADGALLLKYFDFPEAEKKYKYSYMPHYESEMRFNWKELCDRVGVHYISPQLNIHTVMQEILETEVLLTEAMHGAIVADTLRVPWVPVKAYSYIREFKWKDWAMTVDVPYKPNRISSMYDDKQERLRFLKDKSRSLLPNAAYPIIAGGYVSFHQSFVLDKLEKEFSLLKSAPHYLSKESVLESKSSQLMERLEFTRKKYKP